MTLAKAARLEDLATESLTRRTVSGRRVLLVRMGAEISAYEDRCAHLGLPLSDGRLEGSTLICAAHEWEYDARTGRGVNPATVCLRVFPVKVEGGEILVDVDA